MPVSDAAPPPLIWLIGGSDCSAGAGIQADLATAQDLGVVGATVLSAVTAQHDSAVLAVNPLSPQVLLSQLDALLQGALSAVAPHELAEKELIENQPVQNELVQPAAQRLPAVIKVGLLPDGQTLRALTGWLQTFRRRFPAVWLVVDPVLHASAGPSLSTATGEDWQALLAITDLLTPNLPELWQLAALLAPSQALAPAADDACAAANQNNAAADIDNAVASQISAADRISAAAHSRTAAQQQTSQPLQQLFASGVKAIWLKDGHGQGDQLTDQLFLQPALPAGLWRDWPAQPNRADLPPAHGLTAALSLCSPRLKFAWCASIRQDAAVQNDSHRDSQNDSAQCFAGTVRGTGCSLATAISCALAHGMLLPDALLLASLYLQQALRQTQSARADRLARPGWPVSPCWPATQAPDLLQVGGALASTALRSPAQRAAVLSSPGGPTIAATSPESSSQHDRPAFLPLGQPPAIYPVLSSLAALKAAAAAGIHTLQLRLKDVSDPALADTLAQAIAFGRQHQLQLFINDHWQLALQLGAYGVHLGQEDLAGADLQALAHAGIRLGVSTHGYLEFWQALTLRPSYIALGHLFATPTKVMPSVPQGLWLVGRQAALCRAVGLCSVAIGGVTAAHLPALRALGLDGVAMVRAVTASADIQRACTGLRQQWEAVAHAQ